MQILSVPVLIDGWHEDIERSREERRGEEHCRSAHARQIHQETKHLCRINHFSSIIIEIGLKETKYGIFQYLRPYCLDVVIVACGSHLYP